MATRSLERSSGAGISEAPGGESQTGSVPAPELDDLTVVERLIADARFVEERAAHIAVRSGHMLTVARYWHAAEWREKLEALRDELRRAAA